MDGQQESAGIMDGGDGARLLGMLEAALLAADRPTGASRLAQAINVEDAGVVEGLIEELNGRYEATGRAFRVELLAGGYRVVTLPEFAGAVAAIRGMKAQKGLSRAAIETLAIVAYKQPVTRASIETIRGSASGDILRGLLERKLIKISGRAEELGRPMLYATTGVFLETFGLASLKDLPAVGELLPTEGFGEVKATAAAAGEEEDEAEVVASEGEDEA